MKRILVLSLFVSGWGLNAQDIRLDHVIAVYNNIDSVTTHFRSAGFTLKPGRPHANGLINAHIKFDNKTEFELMSLYKAPSDAMALAYNELLKESEGGAYVALSGWTIEKLSARLSELSIQHNVVPGRNLRYITFDPRSGWGALFFLEVSGTSVRDADSVFRHRNGAARMRTVWVEADDSVAECFRLLGIESAGVDTRFGKGWSFRTGTGAIVLVPVSGRRPRVLAISFCNRDGDEITIID